MTKNPEDILPPLEAEPINLKIKCNEYPVKKGEDGQDYQLEYKSVTNAAILGWDETDHFGLVCAKCARTMKLHKIEVTPINIQFWAFCDVCEITSMRKIIHNKPGDDADYKNLQSKTPAILTHPIQNLQKIQKLIAKLAPDEHTAFTKKQIEHILKMTGPIAKGFTNWMIDEGFAVQDYLGRHTKYYLTPYAMRLKLE